MRSNKKELKVETKTIQAPYVPHAAQLICHESKARFKVLDAGRRWGKTLWMMMEAGYCLRDAAWRFPKDVSLRYWVIAPTFPLVEENWRSAIRIYGPFIVDRNIAHMRLMISLGKSGRTGEIEFKSAERSDEGLRGAGLVGAGLDECSRIPRDAWEYGIRPALTDFQGKACFVSTPNRRNWFYDLYNKGQTDDSDWKSWKLPTETNPHIVKEELDSLKKSLPEIIWRQEYMAEFLENSMSVFGDLSRCSSDFVDNGLSTHYSIGVDLARTVDFTVIIVLDNLGQLVWCNRSKDVDWSDQINLISSVWKRYQPSKMVIDSSGVGDPIEQRLRETGIVPIDGLKTNSSIVKAELIERLMLAISQNYLKLPSESNHPDTRWLWEELRSYSVETLQTGHLRYAAPDGSNDDGVMALALAVHGMRNYLGEKISLFEQPPHYTTWGEYSNLFQRNGSIRPIRWRGIEASPGINLSP